MDAGTHISHLLVFSPGFPLSEEDTTCLPAVQQFLFAYKETYPGVKISVISLHYPFYKSTYQWYGITVHTICGENKTGIKRLRTITTSILKAHSIHKKEKVDTVLSFWLTDTALAGKYFSMRWNLPHLIWMHGQDARPGNKYVKLVNPKEGQLAAISAYQADIFRKAYNRHISHIINNGINPSIFPALNTANRSIDFLAAGNLVSLKQYHFFIEILAQLKRSGHHFKAVLAGQGVLLDELKKLAEQYELEAQLLITDMLSHPHLLQMMNDTRIFVHPSSYEGHSTVMLEALYSGCQVVSFIPAADNPVENTTACQDFTEMKNKCIELFQQEQAYKRILVNDMKTSATRIHNILNTS